jgi:hypothetical protein
LRFGGGYFLPKYSKNSDDPKAEQVISQAEWEQLQSNKPDTYITLQDACKITETPESTLKDRVKAGKYRYIRHQSGKIILYRADFDPKLIAKAKAPSGDNLSIDFQMKQEKLRKLKRENDEAESVLIKKLEVQQTHRDLFRIMFADLREQIDKWGLNWNLPAEQVHQMEKDFDNTIKGVSEKLAKRYS